MICSGTYTYTIVYTMSCQPRHIDTVKQQTSLILIISVCSTAPAVN